MKIWNYSIFLLLLVMIFTLSDAKGEVKDAPRDEEFVKLSRKYVKCISDQNKNEFKSLFASADGVGKSKVWSGALSSENNRVYMKMKDAFAAEFELASSAVSKEDLKYLHVTNVVEISSGTDSEAMGLKISVSLSDDKRVERVIITGPIIKEKDGWHFVSRSLGVML